MTPRLSIVVVVFDMAREAPRTLHSLSRTYQLDVDAIPYEVVVVDNGSPEPLPADAVEECGPNFRLVRIDDASPSPGPAINRGVAETTGEFLGVMIDGARILTPGVLRHAANATRVHPNPVIATLGFHLGPAQQQKSTADGYDAEAEDALLEGIGWPRDGYRLFEIAALAGSSRGGWFWPLPESNCLFVRRTTFERVGGYEERFQIPGGGLVNLDFYRRVCELPDTTQVVLVGEGSFHQVHGGASTGGKPGQEPQLFRDLVVEYETIRGQEFRRPNGPIELMGWAPPPAWLFLEKSARRAAELGAMPPERRRNLGSPGF